MKKIVLILVLALGVGSLFAQNATLRLGSITEGLVVGNNYQVGLYLDAIDDNIKVAQFFVEFDPAVIQPVAVAPFNYVVNLDMAFLMFGVVPGNSFPDPPGNELRYVITVMTPPGLALTAPMKMWDFEFTYLGGTTDLTWGTVAKLTPTKEGIPGGSYSKGETKMQNWTNVLYNLTFIDGLIGEDIPPGFIWTGAIDEDWDNVGNWLVDGLVPAVPPTDADDVEIPDVSTKAPFPTIYGSAATGTLTIIGGQLNVAPMADLTTHGMFTNGGTFVIESSGMDPLNPGTGEAGSYIDLGGIAPGGVFEFQRDITNSTPYGSQFGWHFISSPLPGGEFTSDDLYYYYVNWFNSVTQQYVPIEGSATLPCTPAATVANNLMEGWSIKYDDQYAGLCAGGVDDWVVNMIGTSFNTGVQPGIGFNVGWNLLGNPYPNAINPDFITWPAGIVTNSVWMWDGWSSFNWVLGANGAGNNIPPAQGFFLEQATAPGTFTFNGTTGPTGERIHDNFQWWWKNSSDLLKLHATVEGASNADDVYIRFNDVSTVGLDKEWDANKKFAGITETPQIYTTTGGLELAMNTQPETDMVPMSFVCGTAGTYTIEAIETGTFTYVVLEDLVTGVQTNLLEDPYTFDYTNVEEVNNFIVHFAPLGVGELNANSVKIWSLENNIIVNVPANVTGEIAVYNMMGQEVVRTDIEPVETQIPVSDVNTNYVVKVISDSNAVTGKVYVK